MGITRRMQHACPQGFSVGLLKEIKQVHLSPEQLGLWLNNLLAWMSPAMFPSLQTQTQKSWSSAITIYMAHFFLNFLLFILVCVRVCMEARSWHPVPSSSIVFEHHYYY